MNIRRLASLVLTLAATMAVDARAQSRTTFGLIGGVNVASFAGGDVDDVGLDQSRRIASVFGLTVTRTLSPRLAVETGLMYSGKGSRFDLRETFGDETLEGSATFRFGYVEIPALLRLDGRQRRQVTPFLLVGPTVNVKTGCEVTYRFESTGLAEGGTDDCEADSNTEMRSVDVGLVAGIGFRRRLGSLSVRYQWGLRTIDASSNPDDISHRGLAILLSFSR